MSLIEKATDILSRLLNEQLVDEALLTQKNIDTIRKEVSADELAGFSVDINDLIEIVRKYQNQRDTRFDKDKMKIPFAILKFLSDSASYIDYHNKNAVNVDDPTNNKLKAEVVRLGLAYIKADMNVYRAGRQHFTSKKRKEFSLLY